MITGKMATITATTMLVRKPYPNQSKNSGASAIFGMELSRTISGMISLCSGLDQAMAKEISTPSTTTVRKLKKISPAVVPICSHQLFFAAICGSKMALSTFSGSGSTYFLI